MNNYETRAFIFDMDGTLVDNMRFHGAAWQQMLAENGIEADVEDFLIKTAGKTNREIIPAFFAGRGRSAAFGTRRTQRGDLSGTFSA